jgi:hypothetical protein
MQQQANCHPVVSSLIHTCCASASPCKHGAGTSKHGSNLESSICCRQSSSTGQSQQQDAQSQGTTFNLLHKIKSRQLILLGGGILLASNNSTSSMAKHHQPLASQNSHTANFKARAY